MVPIRRMHLDMYLDLQSALQIGLTVNKHRLEHDLFCLIFRPSLGTENTQFNPASSDIIQPGVLPHSPSCFGSRPGRHLDAVTSLLAVAAPQPLVSLGRRHRRRHPPPPHPACGACVDGAAGGRTSACLCLLVMPRTQWNTSARACGAQAWCREYEQIVVPCRPGTMMHDMSRASRVLGIGVRG